jgi:hypothetical protein
VPFFADHPARQLLAAVATVAAPAVACPLHHWRLERRQLARERERRQLPAGSGSAGWTALAGEPHEGGLSCNSALVN